MSTPRRSAGLRADAKENYKRILAAATEAINRDGSDVPLTTIAAEAGVGIGTLYRRFPTRAHLIEAVYRGQVITLSESAPAALAAAPTTKAGMRTWMEEFVKLLIDNRSVPPALVPLLSQDSSLRTDSRRYLLDALQVFLDAGRGDGTLRAEVDPIDILRTATGIASVSGTPRDTKGPLDLLLAGVFAGE